MAIEANLYQDSTAPDFSQTFVGMVEEYGRSFELGLASRHYLKHFPLRLAEHGADGHGHAEPEAHEPHAEAHQEHATN